MVCDVTIYSLTLRAAVWCMLKLALATCLCLICLAAEDAGLLEDTSRQCTLKTHMAQVLENFVFANLASHALTKATRADGEKDIPDFAMGLNRVVRELASRTVLQPIPKNFPQIASD